MATVTAKCVACEAQRQIKEGEVPPGDQPMCEKCGSPMVAIGAQS
jgi:Zn finger protein HypA/HybF involved in hydrogenase expression